MGKRKGYNDRYERFCSLVVEGKDYAEAYREVYPRSRKWKPEATWSAGSKMMQKTDVQEILKRMRKEKEEQYNIDKDDAVKKFAPMIRVNESDYYDDRGCVKPMGEWTAAMKVAFKKFIFDSEGTKIGIELHDVIKVTERLAKMLGWDKPTELDVKAVKDTDTMSIEEMKAELARLEESSRIEKKGR